MTQMESALRGIITPQMETVAKEENISPEFVRSQVAKGMVVIPANINHTNLIAKGIGKGLRTKVNTNFGMSKGKEDSSYEIAKLKLSLEMESDTVMDLSIGGDIPKLLKEVVQTSHVPVGTVPAYQIISKKGIFFTTEELFEAIEDQAKIGVDYMTLHCGVNRKTLELLETTDRFMNCVSRGGGIMINWMKKNNAENPLYEHFDRLLDIAVRYDITLSLGDGFRPGSLHDATDSLQITELITLGELTKRAWKYGVQVMIEGPGHIPLNQIEANMKIQQTLCHNAPFYVLGPLTTDIGAGYDHITSAIGGAVAAWHGADMLCYVTPAEHLRLPSLLDVREGIAASKIAAHSGDIAKGVVSLDYKDNKMAKARKSYNWKEQREYCFDKQKFTEYQLDGANEESTEECTMCGEFCPMKNT